jgi:ribosomal protein L32
VSHFQVLYSGDISEGVAEATVRVNLARRLGIDARKVDQLFSGRTVVLRSGMTRQAAETLQAELADLGAIVRIKDLSVDDRAKFKIDSKRADATLKDITAAHAECPRCGHLQLEAEFCARCGVDIVAARKQKRKEDLLIEKKIRELRTQQSK